MMLVYYWKNISAHRISWRLKYVFRGNVREWQNLWTARMKRHATQNSLLCDGIRKCKYYLQTNHVCSWRQGCPSGTVHADFLNKTLWPLCWQVWEGEEYKW